MNAARPRRATAMSAGRPAHVLDPRRVHSWRMERQLLRRAKAAGPAEVASALVGVQAQVVSSAALAIALRSRRPRGRGPAVDATTRALRDRQLVRTWAMRGTLHLFAAEDLPIVAAALGHDEKWRRPAWLRWFGLAEAEMDALLDAIVEILDDGRPRTRAELADEIGTRLGARQGRVLLGSWGSALKIASDRRFIVQSSEDEVGTRFVLACRWVDGWRDEEPDTALAVLIERYLAAYGPATLQEIVRWWGVGAVAVLKPIVAGMGAALTEVDVDGVRAYVRSIDIDAIEATPRGRGVVHLVGGFDPLIVGGGLREQLLPASHRKRVSRTAGWISPVVLIDGRAAGVWDSVATSKGLTITIDAFDDLDAKARHAIGAAADAVGRAQGLATTLRHGRVFHLPPEGRLLIGPADA